MDKNLALCFDHCIQLCIILKDLMKPRASIPSGIDCRSPDQRILALRILLGLSLVAGAVIYGTVAYYLLSNSEQEFAVSQYESITSTATSLMVGRFMRMNAGTTNMARQYRYQFPNATMWPNVALSGFYDLATGLGGVSSLDNIIFNPIVFDLSKQASFEAFMYNYFDNEPNIPAGAGITPAGPGVWAIDSKKPPGPGIFYHDTTGNVYDYETTYNSSFVEAVLQMTFSEDVTPAQMAYNAHTVPLFGAPLDIMLDCVRDSRGYEDARTNCSSFSDVVPLPPPSAANPVPVPTNMQAFIYAPIVLENVTEDGSVKGNLVGTVVGAVNWKTLLRRAIPSYITGIDCVVTTSTLSFTYRLQNGEPIFMGIGDWHDRKYNKYAESVDLLAEAHASSATSYELTYYPRSEFFDPYQSDTPILTTIGAVAIFIYCIIFFVLYDWAVRRESMRKEFVMDTKRRFVRFISHEMRTPMNTVHLGLKLLDMEMGELSRQLSTLDPSTFVALVRTTLTGWMQLTDDILGNSESAVDVLNDLLNYDKVEMGTLRLELSSVPIWNVVKKTTNAFMMQAKQKSVELQMVGECWSKSASGEIVEDSHYEMLRVVGDSTRIAQVLRNLLSNALKFTPEHGKVIIQATLVANGLPNAYIDVPVDQESLLDDPRAGSVRIAVTDSGAGLSPEQLKQIGAEGVQFNANTLQAGGGSGLGLYISKGLVHQHGGTLTVTSDGLGSGSTFTLELPLFKSDRGLLHLATDSTISSSTSPRSPRLRHQSSVGSSVDMESGGPTPRATELQRILVVDDAASNRKFLMRILAGKGYMCYGAEDGQQAIDAFLRLRSEGIYLDGIVMDFEMPVMNGPTATKVIRDLGCTCFIAGVTGNVLPADIDYFKAQGANVVIAKPLNIDVFESLYQGHRFASERSDGDNGGVELSDIETGDLDGMERTGSSRYTLLPVPVEGDAETEQEAKSDL